MNIDHIGIATRQISAALAVWVDSRGLVVESTEDVPEQGVLRVYSVSGQLIQELTWTKSDLTYAGNNSTSGDLPFNLRTREGTDMASGLYLYVLTATGSAGKDQVQRGKFVIIR